jgi:hypothetical protein
VELATREHNATKCQARMDPRGRRHRGIRGCSSHCAVPPLHRRLHTSPVLCSSRPFVAAFISAKLPSAIASAAAERHSAGPPSGLPPLVFFASLRGSVHLRQSPVRHSFSGGGASICGHLVRPFRKNRNRVNRVNGVIDHTPILARSSRQRSALRAAAASTMRSARPSRRDVPLAAAINQNGAPRKGMTTA